MPTPEIICCRTVNRKITIAFCGVGRLVPCFRR